MEVEWRAGHWDAAAAHAAAFVRWSRETGHPAQGLPACVVSLIEAGRGHIDQARECAAAGVERADAQRDMMYSARCRWVLGQLELSVDDPAAALGWLEPVADMLQAGGIGEPGRYPFTPDLIEAWAATGPLDRAAGRLAWLQDAALRLDHPWARITGGRAEAALLLARRDPAAAAAAVAAVIPEARQRKLPFELGRCLLVLGRPTRRSPRPCTSASRPSRPTSPASTASSACAAGSTWPAAAPAKPSRPHRPPGCHGGGTPAIAPKGRDGLMLIPAASRAMTLTARVFPDASTTPDRAAWMACGRPRTA
jgi:hypothetical protein